MLSKKFIFFFFFQAEDGIRDGRVTGVQTCALPILGAVVYADRTGRGTPESAAEIDRLVTEISSHEAEHEISLAREPTDQAGPAPESSAASESAASESAASESAAPESAAPESAAPESAAPE